MESLLVLILFLILFVYLKTKKQEQFLNLEQVLLEAKLASKSTAMDDIFYDEIDKKSEIYFVNHFLQQHGLKDNYSKLDKNTPVDENSLMADEFLLQQLEVENIQQLDKNELVLQNIDAALKSIDEESLPMDMLNSKYMPS